jgi:hypothetical protein
MSAYLTIAPADHGGFGVWSDASRGEMRKILFAGSLDECLEFIRGQMVDHLNKGTVP